SPSSTLLFSRFASHLDLHSFPTRRSSDLSSRALSLLRERLKRLWASEISKALKAAMAFGAKESKFRIITSGVGPVATATFWCLRSEEHTSELQSRENLVCRLLLEKKKKHI